MKKIWERYGKNEAGVIMVEAAIYFPIVIFTVFAMIYLGMVKYQQTILNFQVMKLATLGAREAAYPGYSMLGTDAAKQSAGVDFPAGAKFDSTVLNEYYDQTSRRLYGEWHFNYSQEQESLNNDLEGMLRQKSFLTGVQSTSTVKISNYVLGRNISVSASYGLKTPAFLNYIGVPMDLTLSTKVEEMASSPSEFARTVDLSVDLTEFLLEKFGVKDNVDDFIKKVKDIKDKVLTQK